MFPTKNQETESFFVLLSRILLNQDIILSCLIYVLSPVMIKERIKKNNTAMVLKFKLLPIAIYQIMSQDLIHAATPVYHDGR